MSTLIEQNHYKPRKRSTIIENSKAIYALVLLTIQIFSIANNKKM